MLEQMTLVEINTPSVGVAREEHALHTRGLTHVDNRTHALKNGYR